jgi:PAS domain S-box-containing protein
MIRKVCWSVVCALAVSAISQLHALDPAKSLFQFNCQNWSRPSGLPADRITSVTQTSDGYIWLGSQNGLIRFDGQEFTVVPVSLTEAHGQDIAQLCATSDGQLYFAISGGGYGRFDGRKFSAIGDASWNAPDANSIALYVSQEGTLWSGSVLGWARWVDGKPEESQRDDTLGSVLTFTEDRTGRLWMGTAERGLLYWDRDGFKMLPDEDLKLQNILAVALDAAGDLWVGTSRGLYHYGPDLQRKEVLFPKSQTNALLVDRQGSLWIGTNDLGLGRYQDGEFVFLQRNDGLGSDSVKALFEDTEGSLWIATLGGLSQLTDLKFPIFSNKEGLVSGSATSVAVSPQGGLWIGTATGASHFDGKKATNYSDPALFSNPYIRRIFESKDGTTYIGDGNRNINLLRNGQLAGRISITQHWPEAFVDDHDGVTAGIGPYLYRLRGDKLDPYPFIGDAPALDWVNSLVLARDGALWVATNAGLFRIKDGRYRRWSTLEGLASNRIHFVLEDIDGSIWSGSPAGLVRLKDEKLTQINAEDGLADNRIYAAVADDHGYLWFSSGRGILKVSRESLTAFAEGKAQRVDCTGFDGLESVKFTDRTDQGFFACKTADGRIWFPNPRGVVMIDPSRHFTNRIPPRVTIQKIHVDGAERSMDTGLALTAKDRSIEFFFTALSYIAPKKVRLRYQLEGLDSSWIEAGSHRSASYNHLGPGKYTFRIQAANADGVWNHEGAEYSINLPPPFYRTIWFYGLCSMAGLLIPVGIYRWKVLRLQLVQKRLQAQNDRLEDSVRLRTDELARSLSLLQATLDSTADGILAIAFNGEAVSHNRQFLAMWNISAEAMRGATDQTTQNLCKQQVKDPVEFVRRINEIRAQGIPEAFDVLELTDGRIFERYCRPQHMGDTLVGIVINFRDITARRAAETAIAEASALLDSLLANTLDVIYFKDRDSRFVRYSRTILPLYGCADAESLIGKNDFDLFPPAEAQTYFNEEQEIIRTGRPQIDRLARTITRNSDSGWNLTTKLPWRDAQGNIIGTFGISRDVTALKETETRLAYERDLLRALMDSSPDQIYFKDRESRFLKCSRAQAKNFRVASTDDLVGKSDFDFFAEEHARAAFEDEQTILRTGAPLIGKIEKEIWADGNISWVLTSKMPLHDSSGEVIGTVGISKDITELKNAEAKLADVHRQLLETSRQAGMAEVATSVLHNVGNVLNSVNVSATLVTEQLRDSKTAFVPKVGALLESHAADLGAFLTTDPRGKKLPAYLATLGQELLAEQSAMSEELGHLRKNIEHIKEIVSMQQDFAKVSGVTETVELTELVEDALRINVSALTRHEVKLVRDYQVKPVLTIERHKLIQVLVNLIRNAKYACDESGRADKQIIVRVTRPDERVRIEVIDNGVGIPAENLTRIFAHGFTTKKEGHGFGLHSGALVMRELGGSLQVSSDGAGLGATFTIEVPLQPSGS